MKDRNVLSLKTVWRGMLLMALCWTAWLSLLPVQQLPAVNVWDKAAHALTYACLTGLALLAFPRARPLAAGAAVMVFGIGIEVAQALGGHRHGEWQDAIANLAGIALAVVVWRLVRLAGQRKAGQREKDAGSGGT